VHIFYTKVLKKKKQSGPSSSRPPCGGGYYGWFAALAVGAARPSGSWMKRVLAAVGARPGDGGRRS
jgi:hypothetical protein